MLFVGEAVISREEVTQLLQSWLEGASEPLQVWNWAQDAKDEAVMADDLVRDLVDCLASLPFDMITVEDVPVMLDALANPQSETDLSINLLWNHLDGVHADVRREALRDDAFCGQFCDGME